MKRKLITKTKNSLRLALSPWETFGHYAPVFLVLFIGLLPLWYIFEMTYLDSYDGVRTAEETFSGAWPWLIVGIILLVVQWRRLKMKNIKFKYTDTELNEAISRTVDEMEWIVEHNNKNVLIAHRPWNWKGSWGERITIVKLKNGLLLNSICNPERASSITSFGWNRRNMKSFLKNLIAVQKGELAKIKEVKNTNENEWSFKKIMMRIVAYPLGLFFIALFCYFVYLQMNIGEIIISIIPATFAVLYIYSDIKLISGSGKTKARNSGISID